ncbi:hypothetical protein IWW37_002083 [Coemansia sp. RSA 2050]|nr:hypothetical protein IWW37_002083 [Coemansia sp. RSA 2050]
MNTPTTPVSSVKATSKCNHHMSAPVVRSSHLSKIESSSSSVDYRQHHSDDADDLEGCIFHAHTSHHMPPLGCTLRTPLRPDHNLGAEFDYESAVRASYFGRRIYPSFDPSHIHTCPIRFVRQFEHAAQHNGLQMKAWAKRFNSCLQGRAEDWAFDECPLEVSGMSWDTRKRQFLDWALLPAEQELRRQRLLRFYQLESDLSIDFVYSFEEAARGLRDYKEDVWVRKCIANLLSPLRSALFELWPDGLPVRFRDLRDSLYAVDWNLYEAASVPLKVVKFANMYSPPAPSPGYPSTKLKKRSGLNSATASTPNQPQQRLAAATSHTLTSSGPTPPESSSNKPATSDAANSSGRGGSASNSSPAGLYDLMQTLSRISEKERSIIMVALEKITSGSEELPSISESSSTNSSGVAASSLPAPIGIAIASPKQSRSRSRLAPASSPASRLPSAAKAGGHQSRAAAAAAIAATAQFACADGVPRLSLSPENGLSVADSASGSENGGTSRTSAADDKDSPFGSSSTSSSQRAKATSRPSGDEFGAATSPLPGGKIRLRTRPLTSMACCNRRQSSPFIDSRGVSLEHNIECATPSPTSFMSPVIPELPDIPAATSNAALRVAEHAAMAAAHQTHARKLSNRKSDSALTTATRSMRAVENNLFYRDSVDHALRSPEFTILHPAIDLRPPHSRRGRFAFIKKLSHMLTPH